VVADGVADDDEWAPFECPDEIATAEVDQVKAKSIKRDIPFALRRGTIGQVTTHHHALDGFAWLRPPSARSSAEDEELLPPHALNRRATGGGRRAGGLGSLNSLFLLTMLSLCGLE
jgi:hypothetical protein